jgi:alpha-D-ribose 1-methylphosphonate 5-triphosphate synthase subunit PhnL
MIFGSYLTSSGAVLVRSGAEFVDIAKAGPLEVLALRSSTLGYVSQFLRVIPRVSCIDVIASSARDDGCDDREAQSRARSLLARLNLPERLWGLPPATFSGGEQQRVNIARGFAAHRPVMLLDEPTSALDIGHQQQALELVDSLRREHGFTVVSAMHDLTLAGLYSDRLALLHQGHCVAAGPAEQVLKAETLSEFYGVSVTVHHEPDGTVVVVPRRTVPLA